MLYHFQGSESLGNLFEYDLDLYSEDYNISFDAIVGQNVTVRLERTNAKTRYFNGYVSDFQMVQSKANLAAYKAKVVPWLWFLKNSADCRIFQEMSIPDIIKQVFRDHGFSDFEESLSGTYKPVEYCVQYRETAFNFVSRLMEEQGIYYFFKHEDGKHSLVLCDSGSAHSPAADYKSIVYRPYESANVMYECIRSFNWQKVVQPGNFAQVDYDFKAPAKDLMTSSTISRSHNNSDFEVFDYPGRYTEYADGETYSKVRIEELHTSHETITFETDSRGIEAGCLFDLTEYPRDDCNKPYLITAASFKIESDSFGTKGTGGEIDFACHFQAIDSKTAFRPQRKARKTFVQGPQTAIITGKAGEEIWTDEHGRVKVQFHWDRESKADENSSCWIRVSQLWAGKKWGAMYIPRIGQEVIVEFLEGDPDKPIITGRIYNGTNKPPYDLPAEKTKSTIKSNSSKGGAGFNEIRLEDKKGEEQIFIHAEKNEDVRVKNDSMEWIGNDRHLHVINNQHELVDIDKHSHVKGDRFTQIVGDDNVTVKGDYNEKTTGTYSLDVGSDIFQKSGSNIGVEASSNIHIKAGTNIVIEAGVKISLKVGGNFVDISPAGVAIKGSMVLINSGGSAGSGGGCSPNAPDVPVDPLEADDAKAGEIASVEGKTKEYKTADITSAKVPPAESPAAKVLEDAADNGTPFCEECEKAKQEQNKGKS
ncbi:MAG: type VI secretion system tip protein VgrG [Lentisphaeraceae bacterium]|nr:type VI secretion system tip protein VgrG [Lentisphaeraceae bacterium]